MPKIHPSSVVDVHADIAADVEIGPFCVVEAGVVIGSGSRLDSHAVIKSGTTMGANNVVASGAILGGDPQDRKFGGEKTFLKIGDRNVFREFVTIHRATGEGNSTVLGDDNYLMAYSHLGHNCQIGNFVTIANACAIAGSVTIEDLATLGGLVAIHQFTRVGKIAMIAGFSRVSRDVPPFMLASGDEDGVSDINAIGLRRIGVSSQTRAALHKACKLLFKSQLGLTKAIETVRREVAMTDEVQYLIDFELHRFKGKSGRGNQP